MMRRMIVVVFALLCSGCGACGVFDSALESEYKELAAVEAASDATKAEALCKQAEEFVAKVEKYGEEAPKGMLDKARTLQQQRAKDFAKAEIWHLANGGTKKIREFFQGANLDPEKAARALGIDLKKAEEAEAKTAKKIEEDKPSNHPGSDVPAWKLRKIEKGESK